MSSQSEIMIAISQVCDGIKELLISKNAKYGNSALDPIRIFSRSDAVEQLLVRIDDKLSRISRGAGLVGSDEDVVNDLIGYLVLLKVAWRDDQGDEMSDQWSGETVEPEYSINNGRFAKAFTSIMDGKS